MGTPGTDAPRHWMERAVELALRSRPEPGRTPPPPQVAAVVVRDGKLLAEAFRGETEHGRHAEFEVMEKLAGTYIDGATLYTTLEPCSRRSTPKRPCAERVIERGISTVYIGLYDPNPKIHSEGWRMLRDAGVEVRDFDPDLRARLAADNAAFIDSFRYGRGETGTTGEFDYQLNGGRYEVRTEVGTFVTRWTECGGDSIYAYDTHGVAHARYRNSFEEIDDPSVFDFTDHSQRIPKGGIAVFRGTGGYLLAKVTEVYAGAVRGHDRFATAFEWEVRPGPRPAGAARK